LLEQPLLTYRQCYLGKKRLERAIGLYKKTVPGGAEDTFTITWHPFYLDPSLPKGEGIDPKVHLGRKFGPDRLAMVHARLKALGEAEGINFSLNGKIGNTRDAHRLVQLAKTKSNELENKIISELFRSHFEEDGNVTSHDMLIAAGEKAGLDKDEVKQWLESGKGGQEVDREVEEAYKKGVHGVPNFTINDRYQVEGAQDAETFVEEFVRVKESAPDVSARGSEGVSC
jgi:predicted DsbA family dithiol-disulfide isomerase